MNRATRDVFLTLALLGLLVIATQTVFRGYGLEELRAYGDADSYLATAETWVPDQAHMPTYPWLIRVVYELTFHRVPVEIIGVSLSFLFLLLTGLAFCTLVGQRAVWLAVVLSLFPVRHFIFSTRILADAGAIFFGLFADLSTAMMEVEGRCRPNEIGVFCRSPRSNSPVGWRPPARAPLLGGGPARRRSRPGGRPALEALPADPVDFFETASSKPMTASLFTGST